MSEERTDSVRSDREHEHGDADLCIEFTVSGRHAIAGYRLFDVIIQILIRRLSRDYSDYFRRIPLSGIRSTWVNSLMDRGLHLVLSRHIGIRQHASLPKASSEPTSLGKSCHWLPFASTRLGLDFVYFMCHFLLRFTSPSSSRICPAHNMCMHADSPKRHPARLLNRAASLGCR